MLVQCPECTTKFNLDESKIGHDGSKVRCSRCKNVFTVFRPMSVESEKPVLPEVRPASAPAADNSFEDELSAMFEDQRAKSDAKPVVDDSLEDDLEALFKDQKIKPVARPAGDESFEDELTTLLNEKKGRPAPKSSVDEDMLADLQGAFQQPLIGHAGKDPLHDDETASVKSKKSGSMGLILGLVFLLLVGAVAGVYFYRPALLGLAPQETSAPKTPETIAKEGAAQIALENVRQYFVPNEKEGQLFIIEGKAVNRFPEARELIRLKASLFDKQGAEVAMQEFMCGNVVSLYQLQVSAKADIEAALTAKVGILTNNTNIQPGASVPFMVVFFHTPDTVEEFGLEVIQSTAPQQ